MDDECQAVFTSCDEDANKGMIEEVRVWRGAGDEWSGRTEENGCNGYLTCVGDTHVRNGDGDGDKLYAVINNTNDPSIATRFDRRRLGV